MPGHLLPISAEQNNDSSAFGLSSPDATGEYPIVMWPHDEAVTDSLEVYWETFADDLETKIHGPASRTRDLIGKSDYSEEIAAITCGVGGST